MEGLPLGLSCLVLPRQPPPTIPHIDKGTECRAWACPFPWTLQMKSYGRWPGEPTMCLF